MTKQLPPGINPIGAIEQQIIDLEQQYQLAVEQRIQVSMTNPVLLKRVHLLREQITECKRTRIDLVRMQKAAENQARSQAYEAKKAQDAAALKARGVRLRRLDEALEELVRQYFSLSPGSFCTARMLNQIDLIKGRIVNESRGRK